MTPTKAALNAFNSWAEWLDDGGSNNYALYEHAETIRHALTANTWRDLPNGWHISWLGLEDGKFTCQITRHDSDLDYRSDISFVSCREYTMQEAYNAAIDTVLNEYNKPEQPSC